jgi:hypothetical protein
MASVHVLGVLGDVLMGHLCPQYTLGHHSGLPTPATCLPWACATGRAGCQGCGLMGPSPFWWVESGGGANKGTFDSIPGLGAASN